MANIKYFNAEQELKSIHQMPNAEFAARFPGVKGVRADSFSKWVGHPVGGTGVLPVERQIEYKVNPSRHECDARCLNASGKIMRCECSCGGKNHGRGAFASLLASLPAAEAA